MGREYKTLRILFAVPELDATGSGGSGGFGLEDNDWLRLEQVEYVKPDIGNYGAYLDSIGSGGAHTIEQTLLNISLYQSACEGDGSLEIEIQVHISRSDLQYSLKASYGTLSVKSTEETEKTKSITVNGADSADLGNLPIGDVTAEWEGEVIGEDGSFLTTPPDISVDGSILSFDQKVTGTIRVSYREGHNLYTLTIPARSEADPNNAESTYQSTVVAVWGGGVEVLEISLPGDLDGGNCTGGGSVTVNPDDDEDNERCVRRVEVRDPCTGDLISTRDETIPCPE